MNSFISRFFCFCCVAASPLVAGWSEGVDLFSQASTTTPSPHVAMDKHGNATAIWLYQDIHARTRSFSIRSAYKPFGKKWQKPVIIARSNLPFALPSVAVDCDGNAIAIWMHEEGRYESIQAAYKPFKKEWSHPKRISQKMLPSYYPQIAVDKEGNATAVWESYEGEDLIRAASKPFKKCWKQSEIISPMDLYASGPQIGVDGEGNATAVWVSEGDNIFGNIRAAFKPFKKCWKPSKVISNDDSIYNASFLSVDLSVNSNGAAAATWASFNPLGEDNLIRAAYKPPHKPWQPPQTASQSGDHVLFPQIALDPKGNATVVWLNSTEESIQASSKTARGSWQAIPNTLSHIGSVESFPQIATDYRGDAMAVWATVGPIEASYKPFKKPWQTTPNIISRPAQISSDPQIAMNSKGYAVAVWQRFISDTWIVQSATFKPTKKSTKKER